MRADRLVETVLFLQTRGRVTAAELARELEVSVATARRDLGALSAAGVPVYPQPGRGGGWALVGGARTDLTGLTRGEAQALFLLVGPAAAVAPEVRSALRKLVRALPGPFRADAQAAAQAVVVDPAPWGAPKRAQPDLVTLLQSAVVDGRRVRLRYVNRAGVASTRVVDPLGLVDKDAIWYLVAGTDHGQRTFRVDRISTVDVTDVVVERPATFALPAAWDEVVDVVERHRSLTSATVSIAEHLGWVVREQFGRHCQVLDPVDGRARFRVAGPSPVAIAQHLAGWGRTVEVVEPPSVRAELARIGAELVQACGPESAAVASSP